MKSRKVARVSTLAVALAGLAGFSATTFAQDAQPQPAGINEDDIVVTARRREERLQDVPVAITALSGDALTQRGIVNVADLAKTTPGLNITQSPRGGDSPYVVLRGQRVVDTSMVFDGAVLFYVNEVPWMRLNGLNQGLYDIQNVQVLRGPQGTQFGKSTTGGAILVNTHAAETDRTGGYVKVTGGNFDLRRAEGAINFAIGDMLAVRFAGIIGRRDGYMHVRNFDYDMNNEHYDGQRMTIHLETGDLTNDLYASRFSSRTHGTANPVWAFDPTAPFATLGGWQNAIPAEVARNLGDFYGLTMDPGFKPKGAVNTRDVTNVTTLRLSDNITLKNIVAYRRVHAPYEMDFDGSQLFTSPTTANAWSQTGKFFSDTLMNQFSEELQLQGTSSAFDWTVGAFYFREKGDDGTTSFQGGTPTLGRLSSALDIRNLSYSAFATGTYRFGIEGLSLSAGARVTRDKRRATNAQKVGPNCGIALIPTPTNPTPAPVCTILIEAAFTEPSWQVSLNYKLDPSLLLYVAHRHGYRSGGVQNRATSQAVAVPFDPETVNDIEIGAKFDQRFSSDLSLTLNAAVYRAYYKGLQRSVSFVSPTNGTFVTGFVNAAKGTIQGLELEGTLRAGNFELGGNIGYTDAKYKRYTQALTTGAIQDLSNLPFGYVPEWTTQARAVYTLPLQHDDEALSAAIMFQSVSKLYTAEAILRAGQYVPSYHTFDGRLGWTNIMGAPLDLTVLVTNLTDRKYWTFSNNYTASFGMAVRFPAPPRRFEVSAAYRF